MKIIAIGDIHGNDLWKKIIDQNKDADKFIFVGDYLDSRENITSDEQLKNFVEIINLKVKEPEKYEVLLGNHDYHYLPYVHENYSGFQSHMKFDFGYIIDAAIRSGVIKVCHMEGTFLFSHAGISKTWLNDNIGFSNFDETVYDNVNELLFTKPYLFGFQIGPNFSNTGDDVTQGPLWIRPGSLQKDAIDGFVQIVGHTHVDDVKFKTGVTLIDSLRNHKYLSIEDNIQIVKTIA